MAEYEAYIAGLEVALALRVQDIDVFGYSILIICQVNGKWRTGETRLIPYNTYLESLVKKFRSITFTHLSRIRNHFADALATLAAMLAISATMEVQPLAVRLQWAPAHVNTIEISTRCPYGKLWYTDIKNLIAGKGHPPKASSKEMKTLQRLATNFIICGEELYRRSFDGMQLLCINEDKAAELIKQIHKGVCGPHMNGKMLSRKILRLGFYWPTMEADCFALVKKCHKCQVYANLIHVPPSELHSLTLPWPFLVWGINIIGKLYPRSSSGHESQTNGAIEAANKNIKATISKMTETYKDWLNKLTYALWAYRTSIKSSTSVTPYSLVYGMEAVLPVELRILSLRIMLEVNLPESEWAKASYQELQMIDEERLRALYHIKGYQRRIERAFNKKV
ncbi:uncharacterized protein LOC143883048 [Tasmannia lanceolata]|uniref:uncharacterized protein LOC143883048 n=1 Tax=Tasmannia lanceolata TaxID=3420 RepID=UPI00406317FC